MNKDTKIDDLEKLSYFRYLCYFFGCVHVCFRWIISTYYRWINAGCFVKYKVIDHWYLIVFGSFRGQKMCPFWGDQTKQTYVNFDGFLGFESACIEWPLLFVSPRVWGSWWVLYVLIVFKTSQPPEDLNNLAGCRIAHQKCRWKFDEPVRYTGSPHLKTSEVFEFQWVFRRIFFV